MDSLGIYIHVPFCGKKCPYCDFYSVSYKRAHAEDYVQAVIRNLRHYSDRTRTVDTLYFGGGTPSLLTAAQIGSIIEAADGAFGLQKDAEITLEANPSGLDREKLTALKDSGINRLSIGVQSMNDDELKLLGRSHTAERAEKAVVDAYDSGFVNISCDLMTALPGQNAEKLRRSAEKLASLPITHISAYILKSEDGTPFGTEEFRSSMPDDDTSAALYLETVSLMEKNGFGQYEISNFARPGFESRHNCRYWKCLDYLGIGPAAHSCFGEKRFAVERDLAGFITAPVQQITVTDDSPCGFEERVMLRLRLTEGLPLDETGEHRAAIEKKIPDLVKAGYVRYDGRTLALTPEGFLVSNAVIGHIIYG